MHVFAGNNSDQDSRMSKFFTTYTSAKGNKIENRSLPIENKRYYIFGM